MRSVLAIAAVLLLLATAAAALVSSSETPFVNVYLSAYGPWDFDFVGWPNVSFIDGLMGHYVWQDGAAHTLSGSVRDLDLSVDYSLIEIGFGWLNNSGGYLVIDRDELGYCAYLEYEAEVPVGWPVRLDSSGTYQYEITSRPDGSFMARVKDSTGWQTMTGPVSHTLPTVDRVFAIALTDGGTASAKVNVDGAFYTFTDSSDSAGGSAGLTTMVETADDPAGGAELTRVQDISGDPGVSFAMLFNGVGAPGFKRISVGHSRADGLPTQQLPSYDSYSLTLRNDDPAKFIRAGLFAQTGYTEAPYDMTEVLTEGPSMWIPPGRTATLSLDLRTIGLTDDSVPANGDYAARDRRRWLSAIGLSLGTNVVESGASDAYHVNAGESLAVSVVPAQNNLSLLVSGDSRFVKRGESPRVYLGQSGIASPLVGYQAFLGFDPLLSTTGGDIGMALQPYPVHLYNQLFGREIDVAAGVDNPGLQNPVMTDALLANILFTAGQTDGAAVVGFVDRAPTTRFANDQGDAIPATLGCSPFIVIDGTPPAVSVLYPNGGEYLKGGSTCLIKWAATDAYLDPYSIQVEYFLGSPIDSPWYTAASSYVNSGSFAWFPIPSINYSGTLVRVTAKDRAGNVTSDVSDAPFVIDSTRPRVDGVSAYQGGGPDLTPVGTAVQGVVNIAVKTFDNLSGVAGPPAVKVTPSGAAAMSATYVGESPVGTHNYAWTIGPTTPNGTAVISVTGLYDRAGNMGYTATDTFRIVVAGAMTSVVEAKTAPDGTSLVLSGPVVTRVFVSLSCFYIEDMNRIAGIRVNYTGTLPVVGTIPSIAGVIRTINGERVLEASSVGSGSGGLVEVPAALGTLCRSTTVGLSPQGLLLRMCGHARSVGASSFTLEDGSVSSVRVDLHGVTAPSDGDMVIAEGVMGADGSVPVLRVIGEEYLQKLAE